MTRRTQATPRRGYTKLLRAAVQVLVYSGTTLGYIQVSKRTATRLLREKPEKVTVEFVEGLDQLFIQPVL